MLTGLGDAFSMHKYLIFQHLSLHMKADSNTFAITLCEYDDDVIRSAFLGSWWPDE